MPAIVFVHGTGVRSESYKKSADAIRNKMTKYLPGYQLYRCYWGDECGASLQQGGASIPEYAKSLAVGGVDAVDESLALWVLLYDDPLYELRILASQPARQVAHPPHVTAPWEALRDKINAYAPSEKMQDLLQRAALESYWPSALAGVRNSGEAKKAVRQAVDGKGVAGPMGRGVTAAATVAACEDGLPAPDAAIRDAIVAQFELDIELAQLAIIAAVKTFAAGLALRYATRKGNRDRSALFDGASPVAGDVLLYQARGDKIRGYIANTVEAVGEPCVLLAHSLGGIASVEALVTNAKLRSQVKFLVTVGSQAAFLYEIGALARLKFGDPLPSDFPKWFNVFDRNDFLSFLAAAVFKGRIEDFEVHSGQPFPQSHSAYWGIDEWWQELAERLK